jgi:phosphopantothenoylcysteine decarboxylase/phosphopantothenate--cysteine ligase
MSDARKHVVLGVTGSIAAYKAAELARLIIKREHDVSVIMTSAATQFVGPITFRTLTRNPVAVDMFEDPQALCPEHISLADRADALLIAPCTANVIAKLAHGLADDVLSCTALATTSPIVIVPAMNEKMWENIATRENVEILRKRQVRIVEPGTGELACGYSGKGRMSPMEDILRELDIVLDDGRS